MTATGVHLYCLHDWQSALQTQIGLIICDASTEHALLPHELLQLIGSYCTPAFSHFLSPVGSPTARWLHDSLALIPPRPRDRHPQFSFVLRGRAPYAYTRGVTAVSLAADAAWLKAQAPFYGTLRLVPAHDFMADVRSLLRMFFAVDPTKAVQTPASRAASKGKKVANGAAQKRRTAATNDAKEREQLRLQNEAVYGNGALTPVAEQIAHTLQQFVTADPDFDTANNSDADSDEWESDVVIRHIATENARQRRCYYYWIGRRHASDAQLPTRTRAEAIDAYDKGARYVRVDDAYVLPDCALHLRFDFRSDRVFV